MTKKHKYRSNCPINFTQEILGDKWSLLIIRDLMFMNKRYYGEFLQSEEKISTNILANRLEKLEQNGLITKTLDPDNHAKYVYSLTSSGIELLPILVEMINWGLKHNTTSHVPPEFLKGMRAGKETFVQDLMQFLAKTHRQIGPE